MEQPTTITTKIKKSKGYSYPLFSTKFLLSALPALEEHSFIGKKNLDPSFFAPHYVGVGGGFDRTRLGVPSSLLAIKDWCKVTGI